MNLDPERSGTVATTKTVDAGVGVKEGPEITISLFISETEQDWTSLIPGGGRKEIAGYQGWSLILWKRFFV